jgi:hypothetical protein
VNQTHPLPRGGTDFIASNRPFVNNTLMEHYPSRYGML